MKVSTVVATKQTTKVDLRDEGATKITVGQLRKFVEQADRSTLKDDAPVQIFIHPAGDTLLGYSRGSVRITATEDVAERIEIPEEES